jgi:peroxiredoxin
MIGEEEVTLVRDVSARRWTFIIGTDGKILHKETQVKAAMDSQNVVAFVKSITEESVVSD